MTTTVSACPNCGKTCKSKAGLTTHMNAMHGVLSPSQIEQAIKSTAKLKSTPTNPPTETVKIEPTSYGVKTTSETYGRVSDASFDWTGKGWAINKHGFRYTHRGDWIHTPLPSSRTNQFYKRTLWEFEEGMKMFIKIIEGNL